MALAERKSAKSGPVGLERHLQEVRDGLAEVSEACRKGNTPQLGAALCHLEYHARQAIEALEQGNPLFRAEDFRKLMSRLHEPPAKERQ